jgi:hypothetical protein
MEIKLFWTEQLTSQIRADTVIMPLEGKRLIKVSTGTAVADTIAQQSQLSIKHLSLIINNYIYEKGCFLDWTRCEEKGIFVLEVECLRKSQLMLTEMRIQSSYLIKT